MKLLTPLTIASVSAILFMQPCYSQELKDQKDKVSYSIGLDIGQNLKRSEIDVNLDALNAGLKDAITEQKPKMTEAEVQEVMQAFQQERMTKRAAERSEAGDKNKKEGTAFLEENKKKDGIITLPSGLQYKVLKEGKGDKPAATDTVSTHYRGTLISGKEFDSSEKNGGPVTFPVNGVIKGWQEALQLMPVGSKWQLYVPSDLAYGEQGAGADIGPNSTLIFDVELVEIKKEAAAEPKTK